MTTTNNTSKAITQSFIPVILIDVPCIKKGEIPSQHLKLNPVNDENEAWDIAKTTCKTIHNSIGYTVKVVNHD